MIDVTSGQDFGIESREELFVFALAGVPFLQLRCYPEYYTLFWLGKPRDIWEVKEGLHRIIESVSAEYNLDHQRLGVGTALYGLDSGELVSLTFAAPPVSADVDESIRKPHLRFLTAQGHRIQFARFDVESDFPLIFWASLSELDDTEIGFSSTLVPSVVFSILRETLTFELAEEDFRSIIRIVESRFKERPIYR
jgi:hypothetical protein